jgi:hypothetical protein
MRRALIVIGLVLCLTACKGGGNTNSVPSVSGSVVATPPQASPTGTAVPASP